MRPFAVVSAADVSASFARASSPALILGCGTGWKSSPAAEDGGRVRGGVALVEGTQALDIVVRKPASAAINARRKFLCISIKLPLQFVLHRP